MGVQNINSTRERNNSEQKKIIFILEEEEKENNSDNPFLTDSVKWVVSRLWSLPPGLAFKQRLGLGLEVLWRLSSYT